MARTKSDALRTIPEKSKVKKVKKDTDKSKDSKAKSKPEFAPSKRMGASRPMMLLD